MIRLFAESIVDENKDEMDIDERLKNSNDNQIAAEKVLLQNANKNDISPVIKTAHRKNAVHYAHIECIPNFDNSILNLQT